VTGIDSLQRYSTERCASGSRGARGVESGLHCQHAATQDARFAAAAQTGNDPGPMAAQGSPSAPRFPPSTLSFLRALKRNNDREWFRERKARYHADVKAPMLVLIERLAADFRTFAPELVAGPKSIYRIYRDTRFSDDKTPLKTTIAASFPWRGLERHRGAGLYIEIAPQWVWAGGGLYAPETAQLVALREHIAANHRRLHAIVESPGFKRAVGQVEGEKLQRVPRGFDKAHPAADYLRFRQFLAGREFPAEFACSPRFYSGVLDLFRRVAPLVRFINEPLSDGRRFDLNA
jgi:uncharacterized protein (TIGR02453 family)